MLEQFADAEHVIRIADRDAAFHAIGAHDDRDTRSRLGGIRGLSFGDERIFRHALAHQIIMPNAAFTVLGVGSSAAAGDYDWRDALPEKIVGMVETRAKNRRGAAIVLSGAKYDDGIGRMQLLLSRVVNDGGNNSRQRAQQAKQRTKCRPEQPEAKGVAGRRDHPFAKNSEMSCDEIAPSRRIFQRASSSVRSTMVEAISRGETPPSTMMGMCMPS